MKGISTIVGVILIIIIVVALAVLIYMFMGITPEDMCINSGGNVSTAPCCDTITDFPDMCSSNACSRNCLENESVVVLNICQCPTGQCWDGAECVSQ